MTAAPIPQASRSRTYRIRLRAKLARMEEALTKIAHVAGFAPASTIRKVALAALKEPTDV